MYAPLAHIATGPNRERDKMSQELTSQLRAVARDLMAHLDGDDSRVTIIRGGPELCAGKAPSASESVNN